jgi:hypothetical protein
MAASSPRNPDQTTRARCELRLPERRDALHADVATAHRCFRREQAEHFGWWSVFAAPSREQPKSLLRSAAGGVAHCGVDARAVPSALPIGRPADVRSYARTPKHRFANCAEHFGSPSIGCGNRADSRLGRGSAAFVPDAQWGAACLESPAWPSARQWIGACSSARRGGPAGKARADAAGLRIFTPRSGASRRGRSSCRSVVVYSRSARRLRSRPRQPTELMHGSDGAPAHTLMHARTHTHAGLGTRVSPHAETEAGNAGTIAYSAYSILCAHARTHSHTRSCKHAHTCTGTPTHVQQHTHARTITHTSLGRVRACDPHARTHARTWHRHTQ